MGEGREGRRTGLDWKGWGWRGPVPRPPLRREGARAQQVGPVRLCVLPRSPAVAGPATGLPGVVVAVVAPVPRVGVVTPLRGPHPGRSHGPRPRTARGGQEWHWTRRMSAAGAGGGWRTPTPVGEGAVVGAEDVLVPWKTTCRSYRAGGSGRTPGGGSSGRSPSWGTRARGRAPVGVPTGKSRRQGQKGLGEGAGAERGER